MNHCSRVSHEHLDCSDNRPALQRAVRLLAGRGQKVLNSMDPVDPLTCAVHHRASNLFRAWLAMDNLSSADSSILRRAIPWRLDLRIAQETTRAETTNQLNLGSTAQIALAAGAPRGLIGSFAGTLRVALGPFAHTPAVPGVEDCGSADVRLWLLRGTFARRDCAGRLPALESERIRRRQLRTTGLAGSRLFSSQHLLFSLVAHSRRHYGYRIAGRIKQLNNVERAC